MNKVNRIAIIPARYNSKRIKFKNIKKFYGKPIISYSILSALKSKLFNKIHVSTDSKLIGSIAKKFGADIDFYRNKILSNDQTTLKDVLQFVVKKYESNSIYFDEIWLIHACAPLINYKDLLKASKKYNRTIKKFPLITLREYDGPIQWAFSKGKFNIFQSREKKMLNIDSKKLKKYFYDSATFSIYSRKNLFSKKLTTKYYGYKLSKLNAVDIDNKEDWQLAKLLFKKNSTK